MYIEAYEQQGIRIDTFVPQNEPGFEPNGYGLNIITNSMIIRINTKFDGL